MMGKFYGFKRHLVINDKGKIIQWLLNQRNVGTLLPAYKKKYLFLSWHTTEHFEKQLKVI
ncbi:MAG: transposase [Bacteroides heparinolyticus]